MRLTLAALLLSLASNQAALAGPPALAQPQPQPQLACQPVALEATHFVTGELLTFKIDALGAELGTMELSLESPPLEAKPRAAFLLKARARTSAFVSTNVKRYDAFPSALLGSDFSTLRYSEEIDEGETHRSQQVDFPPREGKLKLRATKNGEPDDADVAAGPAARDLLSSLYLLRAQPMKIGTPFCLEVYAGRKMWRLSGQVAAREEIDTPLGHFATLKVDATAVRTDDPKVVRTAHVWVSDDERRLPLVAIAEVRGRALRAQLTAATGSATKPHGQAGPAGTEGRGSPRRPPLPKP